MLTLRAAYGKSVCVVLCGVETVSTDAVLRLPRSIDLGSAIAAIAIRNVAASIFRGLPPMRPLARAAFNPALVLLVINSRSNSARAANNPNTNRPFDVVVSI